MKLTPQEREVLGRVRERLDPRYDTDGDTTTLGGSADEEADAALFAEFDALLDSATIEGTGMDGDEFPPEGVQQPFNPS